MGIRLPINLKLAGMWLAAISGLVCVRLAAASEPYLAVVGPAPLRFEPVRSPAWTELPAVPPLMAPVAKPAEPPDLGSSAVVSNPPVSSATAVMPTDEANEADDAMNETNETIVATSAAQPAEGEPPTAPRPAMSGDSQLVTPQMLTDFFKPVVGRRTGRNSEVFVPADIDFSPPVPGPSPSSRATYKSP